MSADTTHLFAAWAWHTSIAALPLAIVAILLWRSSPATWRWWLPAIFFLRLAMPQVPEVSWHPSKFAVSQVAASSLDSAGSNVVSHGQTGIFTDQLSLLPERFLPLLWLLGVAGVSGWMLFSHWSLRSAIRHRAISPSDEMIAHARWAASRMGWSLSVPLRVMPGWSTMAVCGWKRPTLLIPADLGERFSQAQIRGMFLHEMAHVRRRDVLWTWLALGLCALHWFNPLAWLALRRFHADRELACDAAALRALDASARIEYGEALLLCLQTPAFHSVPTLAPFFRHFPELKQRLQNIMTPTSPTLRSRLLTAILVPTIAVVAFTTARAQREEGAPKPAAPDAAPAERPPRDGEKPKEAQRDGDRGAAKGREAGKLGVRDGDRPRGAEREGDMKRGVARDGDGPRKEGPRDGDQPKAGPRDGDQPRKGPRDGEGGAKAGPRDGEDKKSGPRDGDKPRTGLRDGDQVKEGARDGDRGKEGVRDGDRPKDGPRGGDKPKASPREGDAAKTTPRDGERGKPEADKPEAR